MPTPGQRITLGRSRKTLPWRCVAAGGSACTSQNFVTSTSSVSTSTAGNNMLLCYNRFISGSQPILAMRFVFTSYKDTSSGEVSLPNSESIQASVQLPGAPRPVAQITFSGSLVGTMPGGSTDFQCDTIYPAMFGLAAFPANTIFYLKVQKIVTVGNQLCYIKPRNNQAGIVTYGWLPALGGSDAITGPTPTLVYDQGPIAYGTNPTYNNNFANPSNDYTAAVCIGITAQPQVSVALLGDSIFQANGDPYGDGLGSVWGTSAVATNSLGAAQGSWGVGNHGGLVVAGMTHPTLAKVIPWSMLASYGSRADNTFSGRKKLALLKYFTHVLTDYGQNDLESGVAASTVIGTLRGIWTAAKNAGVQHVEQVLILPQINTSSDSWATLGTQVLPSWNNQTPPNNYQAATNALIASNVGSNGLDATLDLNNVTGGFTYPTDNRYINFNGTGSAYTTDGNHPNYTANVNMFPTLQTRAQTWTAT